MNSRESEQIITKNKGREERVEDKNENKLMIGHCKLFIHLYVNNIFPLSGKWNAKSPMSHYEIEYDAKT